MTRRPLLLAAAAATVLALAGCAEPSGPTGEANGTAVPSTTAGASTAPALTGTITVDAASSLNRVFPELARTFQNAHPGTTVNFSFGGSSTLAAQIAAGAPVDVFAAASTKTMQTVQKAGLTAVDPVVIARNRLVIAVPKGDPGKVTGLKDFADAKRTIVVCDAKVPCGAAAKQVFALAKVDAKPDSTEPDVSSVLEKVRADEADAGLVYVTDVRALGGAVQGIDFPESEQAITDYPIAPLKGSQNAALAAAWTLYVQEHTSALQDAGFLPPQ